MKWWETKKRIPKRNRTPSRKPMEASEAVGLVTMELEGLMDLWRWILRQWRSQLAFWSKKIHAQVDQLLPLTILAKSRLFYLSYQLQLSIAACLPTLTMAIPDIRCTQTWTKSITSHSSRTLIHWSTSQITSLVTSKDKIRHSKSLSLNRPNRQRRYLRTVDKADNQSRAREALRRLECNPRCKDSSKLRKKYSDRMTLKVMTISKIMNL